MFKFVGSAIGSLLQNSAYTIGAYTDDALHTYTENAICMRVEILKSW